MGSDQSKSRSSTPQSSQVFYQENYGEQRSTVLTSSARRSPPSRPPPPRSEVSYQTQTAAFSTERQRHPYNYVGEELPVEPKLYPSLRTEPTTILHQSTSQQASNFRPRARSTQENVSTRFENARTWIDSHYPGEASGSGYVTDSFEVVERQFGCPPSAPPAPPSPSPSPTPRITPPSQKSYVRHRSSSTPRGHPNKPQNRNNSSNRNQNNNNDIRCETCNNIYGEKIFQCDLNHSSCQTCKQKRGNCGKCSDPISNRRNFALEKYMVDNNCKIRCPNGPDGCSLSFRKNEINDHLKECPYKDIECPMLGGICNWQGKISQLSAHFKEEHPSNQTDVDTEMLKNISGDSTTVHLITIGKFNFLLYTKVSKTNNKIYMAVQLLGTKISALKWNYEVHIYNKREPRRKFQYTDTCRSCNESLEDIMKGKCVVLPLNYAMTFITEGNLNYKCFIKKEFDDRNKNRNRDRL